MQRNVWAAQNVAAHDPFAPGTGSGELIRQPELMPCKLLSENPVLCVVSQFGSLIIHVFQKIHFQKGLGPLPYSNLSIHLLCFFNHKTAIFMILLLIKLVGELII